MVAFFRVADNGMQLAEGGDFQHSLSYEALKFIYPQSCPTKHVTATFGCPSVFPKSCCIKFALVIILLVALACTLFFQFWFNFLFILSFFTVRKYVYTSSREKPNCRISIIGIGKNYICTCLHIDVFKYSI